MDKYKDYSWDTKERQSLKLPYCFTDFKDDFLEGYRGKRAMAVDFLRKNPGNSSETKNPMIIYSDRELAIREEIVTSMAIRTLYKTISSTQVCKDW